MKNLRLALLTVLLVLSTSTGFAGHRVGNGGDHIRASFILMGEAVLEYLVETEQGQKLLDAHKLSLVDLGQSLDIEKISVTDDVLKDNSGSIVEAIGEPGKIVLNKSAWFKHFEGERDVYYLVFHEMLRSASVNDDNYIISKDLMNFPLSRKVLTKIVPVLPLIAEDNLASVMLIDQLKVAGTGCSAAKNETRIEFDQEKNSLKLSFAKYRTDLSDLSKNVDRKACSLSIPVVVPAKKRVVISQISLHGKVRLNSGSKSQTSFEAFLSGSKAPQKTKLVNAGNSGLVGRTLFRRTEVLKSECGKSDLLRLNSSLLQSGLGSSEVEEAVLDLTLEDCVSK